LAVENARLAAARIDALDVAALVILGRPRREKPALRILVAAIVADIESAVRPRATPFGPPPGVPIGDLAPSGAMRVTALPAISPRMTEPSAIATGPSGNRNPVATTRRSATMPSYVCFSANSVADAARAQVRPTQ